MVFRSSCFRVCGLSRGSILLLLTLPLFFHQLGTRDLTSSHEARAAQNAQAMLDSGDWSLPRQFDNRLDLQKPPLFYWMIAALGWLAGGVDPWMVRLPAALTALGCVFTLLFLGQRLGRPRAGFLAALILATSLHFTWLARVGRIDMPLTFALTLAITGHLLGGQARREGRAGWGWCSAGYVALALGVLLKGPLAIVLFAIWQAGAWLILDGRRATWASSTWWWGYPLTLSLVAPWFFWANEQSDGRLWQVFFVHHNLERGLGTAETLAAHPVWYYLPRLAIDLLPWSLLVPWLAWRRWRRRPGRAGTDVDARRIGLLWFLGFVAFFSLMSFKRADYLLPAFPGFALALGCCLDETLREKAAAPLRWVVVGLPLLTGLGWLTYLEFLDTETGRGWFLRDHARAIRAQTTMPIIFFRAEAHAYAFHVGKPLDTILEWENLDIWATRDRPVIIVMHPDSALVWREHLRAGKLTQIGRVDGIPGRPLVVFRSVAGQVADAEAAR